MEATQTQQVLVHKGTGIPIVTEAQQRESREAHERRKAEAKARKRYEEALRLDRQADLERNRREAAEAEAKALAQAEAEAGETVVATPVVPSKVGVIVSLPTPEELDRRAADMLRYKREQAQLAANRLFVWMRDCIPSREEIEKEFKAALFTPVEGDDATAWRCEGVVIHTDEVIRVRTQEARDAKRRVLEVLRGTDVTAKLEALEAEGFEFSHEDDRGNKVYSRYGVEATLFINQRRDFVATESTPRPKKARGCELVTMTKEDHERNRKQKLAAKLARKPAPKAEKQKAEKKPKDDGKKNKRAK